MDASWWLGCLLGGAVGDALGGPVEFLSLPAIRERWGPAGIAEPAELDGRLGAITDDTQMTLFTAEALLGAGRRRMGYGICSYEAALFYSYLRWLATQGERPERLPSPRPLELRGLLYETPDLHHRRAPGSTCLGALRAGVIGSRARPVNRSKGSGGVMRAAPAAWGGFDLGVTVAVVTHGHPTGYLAAGAFAEVLRHLGAGHGLDAGLDAALERLDGEDQGTETAGAIRRARALAAAAPAGPEAVERLGGGWTAEEALAIAVYAALRCEGDFHRGVRLAVNHSGDSDTTGAMAGSLLGAMLGPGALPAAWCEALEARDAILTVAGDLTGPLPGPEEAATWAEHERRYPYT